MSARSQPCRRAARTVTARARRLIREPRSVAWGRLPPRRLFERYGELARRAGLDGLYLVVSFDCDTVGDADVAWPVHERMLALGVCPSYAVPGELLERAPDVYRSIAETGAEFLNHGYRQHTVKENDVYRSTLFYERLAPSEREDDMRTGDAAVRRVIGRPPCGFRVPHFGTFQAVHQLKDLHRVLQRLGYAYSSSTVPLWGFRKGPVFRDFGVDEFPVSGMATKPLTILDSWSFFAAPDRVGTAGQFVEEGYAVCDLYRRAGAGVLSYYADPSQIADEEGFFRVVHAWARVAQPTSYRALVESRGR